MATGLVDQAVNDILEKILDGVFPPLSSIPKESELADSLGISRLTLREAVKIRSRSEHMERHEHPFGF